jgi:hypothetical protein
MIAELTVTGHTVIHSEGQVIWFFLEGENPAEFSEWLDKHYGGKLTDDKFRFMNAQKRLNIIDEWRDYENK